jgi:catechol 2,3-dioxygenase-like lactoylglutathione lyase family enzyme
MVTSIQPELWVDDGQAAVDFYVQAFGARVLHQVGEDDDVVAQLAVDRAVFWVVTAGGSDRWVPRSAGGATARFLLARRQGHRSLRARMGDREAALVVAPGVATVVSGHREPCTRR